MSETKGREALIGRALIDVDFRERLLSDPETTISAEGYTVPTELVAQLKNIDAEQAAAAVAEFDAAFADRKAAS